VRKLRRGAIVLLSALASRLALLTAAATSPVLASSATVAKISAAPAATTLATTPVITALRATAAVIMVPAVLEMAAAAASDSAAISIVEPPFKPPATWRYEPATLTVKVGTTVTWTNSGAVAHTATADDGKTFDSAVMRPKATFSTTLKSAGTFAYHCTYHRWMKGTIIAVP
jgi:plastocyanin